MKKMRLTSAAIYDTVAIVKANLSGWYMLLALLLFSLFMSSCESTEKEEELEGCFPVTDCVVEATAVNFNCAYGAFQNNWLQLNDGTYLQPWVNTTSARKLVPGTKYKIGYYEVVRDDRYDGVATCLAYVPPGKPIKVTCLEPLTGSGI